MKLVGLLSTVLLLAAPVAAGAQGHGGMAHGGMAGGAAPAGAGSVTHASFGPGFGPSGPGYGAPGRGGPGHGGTGRGGFGGGFHDHGFDHGRHGFHDRFHDHGLWWGVGPYWGWGWPDCGAYGDACDWGEESGPGAPSDDYGYTDGPPAEAACGAWLRHGAGYVWTRRACGDPPAADPPQHAAVASSECSDWVWRADLHRSVCKRAARELG